MTLRHVHIEVHIVLWLALLVVMVADIVTTYMVLNLGGFEKNVLPAILQQVNIVLWPFFLLLAWGISWRIDRWILEKWKSDFGLVLFPVPIMLEVYTVANNIQVLKYLISM